MRRALLQVIAPLALILCGSLLFPGLLSSIESIASYLIFHILAESFAVLIALLIFVVGWHAAGRGAAVSVSLLASAFLGVGILDLLHTLSYPGMPELSGQVTRQTTIYLWLSARFLAAGSLLLALVLPRHLSCNRRTRWLVLAAVLAFVAIVSAVVFVFDDVLPAVFDPVQGLTPAKTGAEYLIILLNLLAAGLLYIQLRQPGRSDAFNLPLMLCAVLVQAMAGIWFTRYGALDDAYIAMGHIYKVIAYLFLFRAVFTEAIDWPYSRLQSSEQKLQATLDAVPDLLLHLSEDGDYLYVHSSDPGFPQAELERRMGRNLWDLLPPAASGVFLQALREAAASGYSRGRQFCLVLDKGITWYELSVARKTAAEDKAGEYIAVCRDISDRKKVETELRLAAAAFETQVAIMVTDARQQILKVNSSFTRITGYSSQDVIGKTPKILSSGMQDAGFYREMYAKLEADDQWEGEIWNRRKNGEVYPEHLNISIVRDNEGNIEYYVANFGDLTLAKQAEERIHTLAYYDLLTNLPNRRMLLDHITRAQNRAERSGRQSYWALLFVDLDNFKTLNETKGHTLGDLLLKRAAERIKACTRSKDIVARPGGDEFALLLNGLSDDVNQAAKAAQEVALKVLEQLSKPYFLDGYSYITTASVGVTVFNSDEFSNDDLLGQAELAMYRAKDKGGNTHAFFVPEMHQAAIERSHLEADLRNALNERQFRLYYQPKVDRQANLQGYEVLLRWQHPRRGVVSPMDFIPLAESTGLIIPIGDWILREVCQQLRSWQDDPIRSEWVLSVNISERQLSHENFADSVRGLLADFGFDQQLTRKLEFEITESMLMQNIERAVAVIRELSELGIHFAMDDFGTGYSSLNYLKMLPLDCVKVDQSFVRDMLVDQGDAAIVEMVIALAKTMNLKVVAEGVETREQHNLLVSLGCDQMQGYFYGRPLPLEQIVGQDELHQLAV